MEIYFVLATSIPNLYDIHTEHVREYWQTAISEEGKNKNNFSSLNSIKHRHCPSLIFFNKI